jgi:hypothetical protein
MDPVPCRFAETPQVLFSAESGYPDIPVTIGIENPTGISARQVRNRILAPLQAGAAAM